MSTTQTSAGACTCRIKPGPQPAGHKERFRGHTIGCPAITPAPAARTTLELRAIARRLLADVIVEEAFDVGRSRGYLDLGGSRRRSALVALEHRAEEASRAYERAVDYNPREFDLDLTADDVRDAFARLVDRRLARAERDPGYRDYRAAMTRNALRRAAGEAVDRIADTLEPVAIDDLDDELARILLRRGVDFDLERIPVRTDRAAARAGRQPRTVEA